MGNKIKAVVSLDDAKEQIDNKMGLFFAGYGNDDAYPKFVHIELYNVIGGKIK